MLNFNNLQFQQILNAYPASTPFTAATPLSSGNIGIPFMDALIYHSSSATHQMGIRLIDKRRGTKYAAIDIIQYTHFSSFLPYSTKINIFTSQFIRLARLFTTCYARVLTQLTRLGAPLHSGPLTADPCTRALREQLTADAPQARQCVAGLKSCSLVGSYETLEAQSSRGASK